MFSNANLSSLSGEIALNQRTLTVDKKIGEGGFAFVYLVATSSLPNGGGGMNFDSNGQNGPTERFCLKASSIQNEEAKKISETEVNILRKCVDHPNIVTLIDFQLRPSGRGRMDHLILMEYMSGGHMFGVIEAMSKKKQSWDPNQLVRSFGQICLGVK